jgi:hypothetical protein
MHRLIRLIAIAVLSSLGLWLTAVGAAAAKPDRQPLPPPPGNTVDFCGPSVGPVFTQSESTNEHMTVFTAKDGTQRIAFNGSIRTTLTTTSGKTAVLNTSGPGTITIGSNSFSVVGRGLNLVGNETGIWLYAGRIVIDPANGMVISSSGRVTNVCQMLSS